MTAVAIVLILLFCGLMSLTQGSDPAISDTIGARVIVGVLAIVASIIAFVPVPWEWF